MVLIIHCGIALSVLYIQLLKCETINAILSSVLCILIETNDLYD